MMSLPLRVLFATPPRLVRSVRSAAFTTSTADAFRTWFQLFWLMGQRSFGWLVIPLSLALSAFVVWPAFGYQVVLWDLVSVRVAESFVLVGALGAGFCAWHSQRMRVLRVRDQNHTASLPVSSRDLALVLSGVVWPVAGYIAVVAFWCLAAWREATWAGPVWGALALGGTVVTLYAVIGGVVGFFVRARAVPLAVAGATFALAPLYGILIVGDNYGSTARALNPLDMIAASREPLFHGDEPGVTGWLIVCIALLALAVLLGFVISRVRLDLALVVTISTACLAAASAAMTLHIYQEPQASEGALPAREIELTCEPYLGGKLCVHPAYERRLPNLAPLAEEILGPFAGLPGAPDRIEQADGFEGATVDNEIHISLGIGGSNPDADFARKVAAGLFLDATPDGRLMEGYTAAQLAILRGLTPGRYDEPPVELHDWFPSYPREAHASELGGPQRRDRPQAEMQAINDRMLQWRTDVDAAAERFAALSPEEQRAWLEANWDALRAGVLTLEDLP